MVEIDAPDGIDIVAGARYYVLPGGERCEFAVTVADSWQGAGLASRPMRALIQGAGARGLKRMEGFVLAENDRMLVAAFARTESKYSNSPSHRRLCSYHRPHFDLSSAPPLLILSIKRDGQD